jgi:MerR family transcriptional regulator, redox-sensitive transcriptional activator SoxR
MDEITIGKLAKRAHLQPSALRYYESVGLLSAARRIGGQRRYSLESLQRLNFIRLAQQAGFTIAEIKILLEGFGNNPPPVSHWQDLAHRKIAEINAVIERNQQMKELLEEGLRCGCLDFTACQAIIQEKSQT